MSGKLSTELHQVLLSSFRDRASVDQFASTLAAAERSLELLTPYPLPLGYWDHRQMTLNLVSFLFYF